MVFAEFVNEEAVSPTLTVPIPDGYMKDDVLFIFPTQDGGGGTFTPSAGWTSVFGQTQFGINGQRTWGFYKVLTTNNPEAVFVNTSSINENQGALVVCVRGADTTNPIDVSWIQSSDTQPMMCPSVVTTTSNALLLVGSGNDNQATKYSPPLGLYSYLTEGHSGGAAACVGFGYKDTAGETQEYPIFTYSGGNGVTYTVAIRDNGSNARRGYFKTAVTPLHRFGIPGNVYSPTWTVGAPNAIATTIDGRPCGASVPTVSTNIRDTTFTYPVVAQIEWGGASWAMDSAKDLSQAIVSLTFTPTSSYSSLHRYLIVFGDAAGGWAAFETINSLDRRKLTTVPVFFCAPGRSTPAFESGTINWSAVTKFGLFYSKEDTTATRTMTLRSLIAFNPDSLQFIPGGNQTEFTFAADFWQGLVSSLDSSYPLGDEWAAALGSGLLVTRVPFQIGASSAKMDGVSFTSAIEGERPYKETPLRKAYQVSEFASKIGIHANATDTLKLGASMFAFSTPTVVEVLASASPSADYNFNGLVVSGAWVKNNSSGVVINGASLISCFAAEATGGFDGCVFRDALEAVALRAPDPSVITNNRFIQRALGGHAIEITQPGTFAFVGNTFDGYGLDGTTDAAIYNNSGGHVVLNVSGGGDTPTVRNGVGATTEVVSGAQVTVVGLATGSQVKVTKVSDGSVLFNGAETLGQVSFSTTYIGAVRVEARKASASPFYRPWATQATTISGQTVEVTALQELDE